MTESVQNRLENKNGMELKEPYTRPPVWWSVEKASTKLEKKCLPASDRKTVFAYPQLESRAKR